MLTCQIHSDHRGLWQLWRDFDKVACGVWENVEVVACPCAAEDTFLKLELVEFVDILFLNKVLTNHRDLPPLGLQDARRGINNLSYVLLFVVYMMEPLGHPCGLAWLHAIWYFKRKLQVSFRILEWGKPCQELSHYYSRFLECVICHASGDTPLIYRKQTHKLNYHLSVKTFALMQIENSALSISTLATHLHHERTIHT
ncbi:uncharacterized protein BDR25DRAFT_351080 [Lindgomyces ingoldianus]|uniref:Uncharacterized protein n=1 Tax=Lindgomyces ingoldianus TaxID=673940 RepID=A0ACB6R5M3_9PLEO|nr:uncharacterized protein BDR25DRAFT_351080 [Lindgomyces ingoldianus]KAF2474549.1 hypothetical protein BDR25DRAFT_351080 [Lindgomyces ingoldianus]